jgi:hypothetical protein
VRDLRKRVAAVALIAGILAATGALAFAGDRHPVCVVRQHDCGAPVRISSCCCGDQGTTRRDTTPAQPRIDIQADLSSSPTLEHVVAAIATPQRTPAVHTSPPGSCLLDLPTLFATLLI